jgi:hypothetical protein
MLRLDRWRAQRINFYKLDTAALKRYRRFYKLPDVGNSKEQLVMAVGKHFMSQVGLVA